MATETLGKRRLAPLEITCSSADCKSGLHCFTQTKKMKGTDEGGKCRYCGAELVDWTRTHKRDLDDVRYTFEALRYELWRHHYWHIDIEGGDGHGLACTDQMRGVRRLRSRVCAQVLCL